MRKTSLFIVVFYCFLGLAFSQTKTGTFSGLLRDFCGKDQASPACTRHPDFECCIGSNTGVVAKQIGSDRKPVWSGAGGSTYHGPEFFNLWYRDNTTFNMQFPISLTLSNAGNSNPRILSFTNQAFFPLTGKGFGNQGFKDGSGTEQNFHFTMELHARFGYQGGEVFSFTGDDDLWVFINDQLVIDLGGVHSALSASVSLDSLGLVKGSNYRIDFFYAERHTVASTIRIDTTLEFFCAFVDRCGVCEGAGDSCPCTCNDNNACTADTCDPLGGCIFTPKVCNDNSACTTDSCNTGTGACVFTPVTCNDNNACTIDTCSVSAGCQFTPINCNDNSVCTTDSCVNGACVFTPITCTDNNACTIDSCSPTSGCQFTPKVCVAANPCIATSCSNGVCQNDTSACNGCQGVPCTSPDACHVAKCNAAPGSLPGTGVCSITAISCDDGNACTTDTCNGASGCVHTDVVCPGDACNPATCNPSNGQCSNTPINCDDGNFCTDDSCAVQGGDFSCVHVPHVCNDNNNCTVDTCVGPPGVNSCVFTPLDCNDGSNCTADSCDQLLGCVHSNLCVGNACEDTTCVANQCFNFARGCPIDNPTGVQCFTVTCDPAKGGCQKPTPNPDRNNAACNFLLLPPAAKGGIIGAGVIAAIVIAVVAVALLSAFGAKKGYDYWKKQQSKFDGVNTNPLYTESGTHGENPLYTN